MTEESIKLFASQAERYPQPTEADVIHGGTRASLAAIPVIGGTVTELLSMMLAPAVSCRRDEWFREIADGLDHLEAKVEGFKVDNLVGNEVLVSAAIRVTRAAAATDQQEISSAGTSGRACRFPCQGWLRWSDYRTAHAIFRSLERGRRGV